MIASQSISQIQLFSERFNEKVKVQLQDEFPFGYTLWIEPLRVIDFKDNRLTLYTPVDIHWLARHYGQRIKALLNENTEQEIFIEFTNKEN